MSFMSDSLMAWKPRIDDPSNIWPSVKKLAPTDWAGTLKCCMTPGRSQKRTSMNLTSSSLTYFMTSSALLNIQPPRTGSGQGWPRDEPPLTRPGSIRDARHAPFPESVSVVSAVLLAASFGDSHVTTLSVTSGSGPQARHRVSCSYLSDRKISCRGDRTTGHRVVARGAE